MKLKNLMPGYVCVTPVEDEYTSSSGISAAPTTEEKPTKGKVVMVGEKLVEGDIVKELNVKEGDVILFQQWGNQDSKIDMVDYKFIKFSDVIAVLEE